MGTVSVPRAQGRPSTAQPTTAPKASTASTATAAAATATAAAATAEAATSATASAVRIVLLLVDRYSGDRRNCRQHAALYLCQLSGWGSVEKKNVIDIIRVLLYTYIFYDSFNLFENGNIKLFIYLFYCLYGFYLKRFFYFFILLFIDRKKKKKL